jgi:hypothetical protein
MSWASCSLSRSPLRIGALSCEVDCRLTPPDPFVASLGDDPIAADNEPPRPGILEGGPVLLPLAGTPRELPSLLTEERRPGREPPVVAARTGSRSALGVNGMDPFVGAPLALAVVAAITRASLDCRDGLLVLGNDRGLSRTTCRGLVPLGELCRPDFGDNTAFESRGMD